MHLCVRGSLSCFGSPAALWSDIMFVSHGLLRARTSTNMHIAADGFAILRSLMHSEKRRNVPATGGEGEDR